MSGFGWGEGVFTLFSTFLSALPLLFAGILVLVWHRTRRPKVPSSTAQAVSAAGHDPARPPERPVGQWNARVVASGRLEITGDGGTIRIENGWLGFHAGDATTPTWLVPAHSVRAGKNSMLSQGEVWLETGQTGRLNLTVSHEHINLISRNDFKDQRERRYADEFLWLLHQSGATVVAG